MQQCRTAVTMISLVRLSRSQLLLRIVLVAACFLKENVVNGACPPSWAPFGDHCYILSPSTWDQLTAEDLCKNRGGHLASISSQAEQDFLFSLVEPIRQTPWLGAIKNGNQWVWTDGSTPGPNNGGYSNWCDDCPNNDAESTCTQLQHWDGLWSNVPCHWSMRGICKRRNDIIDPCDFENGWHSYKGHCYKYSDEKKTWADAAKVCADGNGILAVLNTPDKWNMTEELVACKDYQAGIWLGLSDTETQAEYRWTDGSTLTAANWDSNQPQNMSVSGNNCVRSLPLTNFKWRVDVCDRENEFLCEKPEGTCSEGWYDEGTGYCYLVVGENELHRRTWADAERYCQATGSRGHLMKIENPKQQEALVKLTDRLTGVSRVRIGLSDASIDNFMRWSDGATVVYTNYGIQEHVLHRMDCGYVDPSESGRKWNTGYCFDPQAFICQLPIHSAAKVPSEDDGWLCPDGWVTDKLDGKCYQFVEERKTYDQAKSSCASGSILLTVLSAHEQSFVTANLRGETWLGLEYKGSSRYEWHDHSVLQFQNFAQGGQNTGGGTSCTSIKENNNRGEWTDQGCNSQLSYICKMTAIHSTATPLTPTAPWHSECGPGWSYDYYGQTCFKLVRDALTWDAAQAACEAEGSNLASIHSLHEQNYINALVMQNVGWISFWIGANDINPESGWKWSDGSAFYFWNWNTGEPNNHEGAEFCVEMSADMRGMWNDANCDQKFSYICEKRSSVATPAPSAAPTSPPVVCTYPAPLISGEHYVRDLALSASTSLSGRSAAASRMYDGAPPSGSWTADSSDTSPWIGVHFTHYVIVGGVRTWGALDRDEWVRSYRLSYRLQTGSFYEYFRDASGAIRVFDGNTDRSTMKEIRFEEAERFLAHGVRLHPVDRQGAVSMRFEILGCRWEQCKNEALISGEAMVPDSRMTASGSWDYRHNATRARLHSIYENGYFSGWVPNTPYTNQQWIQVEFDTTMTIYGVQTLGRDEEPQWITSYKILYTDTLDKWETFQSPYGTDKIFQGNTDRNTLVTNYFSANIYGVRYVRLNPQTWNEAPGLRFEILGCNSHRDGCEAVPMITGEHSYVPNSRLTASSSWDITISGPARSRLHQRSNGNLAGAWVPLSNDVDQWIQADLGREMLIMAVATQGRHDMEMYVKTYKLSSSHDGTNFNEFVVNGATKVFEGNWEQHRVHKYFLDHTMTARYVRLHPLTWFDGIALRWEIYACSGWAAASEVGCYADSADNRDLTGSNITMTPEGMTRETCVQFCRSEQYLYAGVQLGEACYCGNSYGKHGTSLTCVIPCRGDPSTFCGGSSANTILHTGIFSPDQVLGCYSDTADRDLPYERYLEIPGGSTQQYCAMHCFTKGYRYAGAQYAAECSCGNSYGRYGLSTKCDKLCPGDRTGSTICGGEWSNTIMSTGLAADHPRCQDGWILFENRCYHFSGNGVTWVEANALCKSMRAELATVNSQSVNDFIYSRSAALNINLWIGLHCKNHNNYFEWTSGNAVWFSNWDRREPNNWGYDENCVELFRYSGKWNDDPCDDRYVMNGYVCQAEREELPEATTPPPDPTCPEGWSPYRWKCFTAVGAVKWNWAQARAQCETLGGHLVRIEDGSEQAFLTATYGRSQGTYWTDLREQNGRFVFTSGESASYTHWAPDQPVLVNGEACVTLNMTEHGLWHNVPCETQDQTMSICEVTRAGYSRPITQPTQPAQGDCASGWIASVDQRNCLLINHQLTNMRLTWSEALVSCREIGADLVSIHSIEENNQIRIYTSSKMGDFWIGLNAIDGTSGFTWSDGSPVNFEAWSGPGLLNADSPQLGQQRSAELLAADGMNCVDMYAATASWNKISCDSRRNWICKMPRGVVPQHTTTVQPPSAGPPGSCSPDSDHWKFFNDRCYYFSGRQGGEGATSNPLPETTEAPWWEAEARCMELGGNLLSLHTEEEQRFVEGQIRAYHIEAFNLWMGLHDMNPLHSWQWSDGTPTDYIHWENGEPNNEGGMELCGAMEINAAAFGTWSDRHCQNARPFVCTKRKGAGAVTTPVPSPMPGYCPEGYWTHGNKCFKYHDEQVDWSTALQRCLDQGAKPYSLATINDPWEQAFLTSKTRSMTGSRYWIGLHQYHGNNGEFGWVDNTRITFSNWNTGEPNGGTNEGCVSMYADGYRAGLWNDDPCGTNLGYICMRMRDADISTSPAPPVSTCPAGYVEWEGNCYHGNIGGRSWQQAEDECVREGGHLTGVADLAEQAYVTTILRDLGADRMWIGLSDRESVGRYLWVDGTTVMFTSWGPGKPGISSGGCVYLDSTTTGQWSDSSCDQGIGYICKITRVPPPYTRPPSTGGHCPAVSVGHNWFDYEGHCYLFMPEERLMMSEAILKCQQLQSHLVSVHSDAEVNFITSHFQTSTFAMTWLGLMKTQQGGLMWLDGSSLQYYNWNTNEPNDVNRTNGEDCVEMYIQGGKWNDVKCDNRNGYVCKKAMVYIGLSTGMPTALPSVGPTQPSTMSQPSQATTSTAPYTGVATTRTTNGVSQVPTQRPAPSEPLTSGGIAGIVFSCIIIAMTVVVAALLYLKKRGTIKALDTAGFDNPAYGTGQSSTSPAYNAGQGMVSFHAGSSA